MIPKRFQRRRTKGYIMPPNTISIARPSKWSNPFRLYGDMIYVDASHRRKILSPWVLYYQDGGHTIEDVVKLFRDLLFDLNSHEVEEPIRKRFELMRDTIRDLTGKNLACFCKEGEICHGDPLIELANSYE